MRTVLRPWIVLFAVAVAVPVAGCSDQYSGRMAVSGSVNLQGKPLPNGGSIHFTPLDGQDTGTEGGGPVEDGAYDVPRKKGLKPGKYSVQISLGDGKTPNDEEAGNPGGSTNIVSFDLIPDDWNRNSKQQIEVKSSGGNKFDFDIPNVRTLKKK